MLKRNTALVNFVDYRLVEITVIKNSRVLYLHLNPLYTVLSQNTSTCITHLLLQHSRRFFHCLHWNPKQVKQTSLRILLTLKLRTLAPTPSTKPQQHTLQDRGFSPSPRPSHHQRTLPAQTSPSSLL
jgi:hypothetical protein